PGICAAWMDRQGDRGVQDPRRGHQRGREQWRRISRASIKPRVGWNWGRNAEMKKKGLRTVYVRSTGFQPVPGRAIGAIRHGLKTRATYIAAIFALLVVSCACGQTTQPTILNDVGIDQKLDAQVPGDLTFKDENGATIQLSQYYGKRPIVLALVYYKCPMLCTMVLNDLNRVLGAMQMNVGEQFDILTVSFDPTETPELAAQKKHQYVRSYGRPHAEEGWHFL